MTTNASPFESIVNWITAGYPEGVPRKDYFPLLALLKRSLSEEEITKAIITVFKTQGADEPVTEDDIRHGIEDATDLPADQEAINQVAARLAAVGWPLANPEK